MLEQLLESRARRSRSLSGPATSITAHVVVIVIAVHATAQSKPRAAASATVVLFPYVPVQTISGPIKQGERRGGEQPLPRPRLPAPISFDPKIPPIDFAAPSPTNPADFLRRGITGSPPTEADASRSGPSATFRADQVERQASLLPGAPLPVYPATLREAGIEGTVVAQFVVDEHGTAETDSVRFVRSDNGLFEESVRRVLQRMRFSPAEIGGKRVRQLVQMPFVFTIGR